MIPPEFAKQFDDRWTKFVQNETPLRALLALGVYELLDGPDYTFLYREIKATGLVGSAGLEFFKVHAEVRHFDLFEEVLGDIFADEKMANELAIATQFVLATQEDMWRSLARHLTSELQH